LSFPKSKALRQAPGKGAWRKRNAHWGWRDYRTIGDPFHGSFAPEAVVSGHILALTDYLYRLQVK
jgi:hypothetical protein